MSISLNATEIALGSDREGAYQGGPKAEAPVARSRRPPLSRPARPEGIGS